MDISLDGNCLCGFIAPYAKEGKKEQQRCAAIKNSPNTSVRERFSLCFRSFFGNRQNRIVGKQVIYGYEEILRNRFQRIDALRVRKEAEEALYGGFLERYYAENHVGRQRK